MNIGCGRVGKVAGGPVRGRQTRHAASLRGDCRFPGGLWGKGILPLARQGPAQNDSHARVRINDAPVPAKSRPQIKSAPERFRPRAPFGSPPPELPIAPTTLSAKVLGVNVTSVTWAVTEVTLRSLSVIADRAQCLLVFMEAFGRKFGVEPILLAAGIVTNVGVTHGRQFTGGVLGGVSGRTGAVDDDLRVLIGD
jgi:hypothetical protein